MLIVGTFTMLPVVNWLLFVLDDGDSFVLFPWMWEWVYSGSFQSDQKPWILIFAIETIRDTGRNEHYE